mmetsp:Transcript_14666/g.31442  ORF Transcript_14666/g.31442 Transcript_14666/m.31442 type:complete len:153 (-) Transcript_14666:188-646(-)|eukprot:CAMPEP_0185844360 /NCGR_PEP_ID=MMETSP1354-20130828/557_1 /TAXON_ID=708628 /ORGANISM="Erythrolobus madagascarensis, Strain CCMP3276" /LENGTH=152 /DNA_ID=CAMNT_0028544009 /DNA_START=17 /DNA_END=475 /DNA_ORIENTATION=-
MTSTAFVGCGGVAVRRVAQRSAICVPMRVKRAGGLHSGPVMTKWFMSTDTVSPKEFITDALQNSGSRVVIFSKSTCPFCARVKQLFDSMGEPYNAIELNKIANGGAVQMALLQMTGQRTVPNVFVNQKHVGGCDDTMAAKANGELEEMLSSA